MKTKARDFAIIAHGEQKYGGKPYVEAHLDLVAKEVTLNTEDQIYIAVAYLHDVLEDTLVDYDELVIRFGETIAEAVYDLTDGDGATRFERQYQTYARCRENAISRLVKLCDRITNMKASFKTKHAFTYINEYERFKGSLYVTDCNTYVWAELDAIYHALKQDIGNNKELYLSLLPSGAPIQQEID